jgi:hypothetical protein
MVEHSALESLVQRLSSFNESIDEEAEAVANTLAIFENMVELSPLVRSYPQNDFKLAQPLVPWDFETSLRALCSAGHCGGLLIPFSHRFAHMATQSNVALIFSTGMWMLKEAVLGRWLRNWSSAQRSCLGC